MTKLIVEMEMPKSCSECEAKCASALYGRICGMKQKNIMPFLDKTNRPDWCPIKCELVRCGECEMGFLDCGEKYCGGEYHKLDWFCADGERKDGEHEERNTIR